MRRGSLTSTLVSSSCSETPVAIFFEVTSTFLIVTPFAKGRSAPSLRPISVVTYAARFSVLFFSGTPRGTRPCGVRTRPLRSCSPRPCHGIPSRGRACPRRDRKRIDGITRRSGARRVWTICRSAAARAASDREDGGHDEDVRANAEYEVPCRRLIESIESIGRFIERAWRSGPLNELTSATRSHGDRTTKLVVV